MSSFGARWQTVMHSIRTNLDEGEPLAGLFVALTDPALMHLWSQAGADFVILDLEHSSMSLGAADRLVEAAVNYGIAPVVRARKSDEALMMRCLDAGACGVMLPDVRRRNEVDRWVDAVSYPPNGSRGVSSVRVRDWGGQGLPDGSEYRPLVVPMIESVEAVGRARELLSDPGPNWWHIGLVDLAMDVRNHPDQNMDGLVEAIEHTANHTATRLGVNSSSQHDTRLTLHAPAAVVTTDRSLVVDGGRRYFGKELSQ